MTAGPTALPTTKPTRAGSELSPTSRWTTSLSAPARRPRRAAARNDAGSVRRWARGSNDGGGGPKPRGLRQPGSCGPCGGARKGSRDQRGCACAGGNRAPCDGGGCSAGTYACSRALPSVSDRVTKTRTGVSPRLIRRAVMDFGWHRPPAPTAASEGPSAPLAEAESAWTCGTGRPGRPPNGTRCEKTGSNQRPSPARDPSNHLWMTGCSETTDGFRFNAYRGSLHVVRSPGHHGGSVAAIAVSTGSDLLKWPERPVVRRVSVGSARPAGSWFTTCGKGCGRVFTRQHNDRG